jgi:hypothetical protein
MYRFERKIEDVIHNYQPYEDGLILIRGSHERSYLEFIDKDGLELQKIEQVTAYDFIRANNRIIFTNKEATETFTCDLHSKKIDILPYVLHIKGHRNDDEYLCYSQFEKEECFLIISLNTLDIVKKAPLEISLGTIDAFLGEKVITSKKRSGKIALVDISNHHSVWQLDIPSFSKKPIESKVGIDSVYINDKKDQIYVLFGSRVICLKFSGEIFWTVDLEFRPTRMHINGDIGYIITSGKMVKIDLLTGQVIFSRKMEDIEWAGQKLVFQGSQLEFFKNLLWCPVQTSGHNFICAVDPESGETKWIHNINAPHFINLPKFYNDKMYVLDTGGNLYFFSQV